MGFKQTWHLLDVQTQIRKMGSELTSPYNDGFTQWGIKKELYEIKFLVDGILQNSGYFGNTETEFLEQKEKEIVWKTLKDAK